MRTFRISFLTILSILCSCGIRDTINDTVDYFSQEPDGEPIRQVITTSSLIGYAASVTLHSINTDSPPAYVRVASSPATYPGTGLVYVDPPNSGSLPPAVNPDVRIAVAGYWDSDSSAVLSVVFIEGAVSMGGIALQNMATFPVVRNDSCWMAVFAKEDINSGTNDTNLTLSLSQSELNAEFTRLTNRPSIDTSISVDQSAWIVQIFDNGTADSFSDDYFSIIGAGQHVGVGFDGEQMAQSEFIQLVLVECNLEQSCRLNPTAGWGMVRHLKINESSPGSLEKIGTSVWDFHNTCNGKAAIVLGTGTFMGFSGKSVDLDL